MKFQLPISLFLAAIISNCNSLAQNNSGPITVSSKGGSFDYFCPWGEGSIGVVYTQYFPFTPKSRSFQYFNDAGELVWNVKIKPYNFNNYFISNIESDFCYYINASYNSSFVDKTSKEKFLHIYRFDKMGKLVEHEVSFDNPELAQMKSYIKGLYTSYFGAYDRGFISVTTNDQKHFHIVKVDEEFNITYNMVELHWDEKAYAGVLLSKPIYCLNNEQFCIIQTTREVNKINAIVHSIELENFQVSNQQHTLNPEDINLTTSINYSQHSFFTSDHERNNVYHTYLLSVGNTAKSISTLGAYTDYSLRDGKLICTGVYRKIDDAGFVVFEIDPHIDNNEEITPKHVFHFEHKWDARSCNIDYLKSGEYVFLYTTDKNKFFLKTSTGKAVEYDMKTSYEQAFVEFLLGPNEELPELYSTYKQGNNYVFTNESKRKKATIYRN